MCGSVCVCAIVPATMSGDSEVSVSVCEFVWECVRVCEWVFVCVRVSE